MLTAEHRCQFDGIHFFTYDEQVLTKVHQKFDISCKIFANHLPFAACFLKIHILMAGFCTTSTCITCFCLKASETAVCFNTPMCH